KKLKERIKSLSGNMNMDKVKKDTEEIETINIELDHRVSMLIAKNEHLKQTYKQLYDSIKSTRVRSKEQRDALTNQANLKYIEIFDLNANLQEKGLIIAALRVELRKLKGKVVVDNVVQIVLSYLDYGCSKHMTRDRSQLTNFVNKYLGTVKFGNDHVAKIVGYGDYQIGNVTISRVYYVKGLGYNLFFVGQLCDSNLEVSFRQHTSFIRNQKGVDLLIGSRGNNLYTLSLGDMMASSPICLLLKASKTKSWLWHRRLSHLNFGAINHLARHGLVRGPPKLKFEKDHLCSACVMGKSNKKPHKPKSEDTNQEKIYLLHMDLCGLMLVASVNRKKYILFIVDDYSRFTWKNGVVERQNRMLIEAARIMLIYAKALLFLWAETVATTCYTQNCSIIRLHHGKTPYELLHNKPPNLLFLYMFGALCYPTNDNENLGKLQPKANIGIFIGYAPTKKAFWIYNKHTRRIIETIHVDFDVLIAMASEHSSSEPALHEMTPAIISSGLVPNRPPSTPFVPPSRTDGDLLFQTLFDKLLTPLPSVDHPAPEVIALIAKVVAPEPMHQPIQFSQQLLTKMHHHLALPDTGHISRLHNSEPALHEMTPAIISSGLVPNRPPSTPFVPPSRTDGDLFSSRTDASTNSIFSATVDQDAPSPSNSQTTPNTLTPIISNDFEEDNHDLDVAHMNNYPFFGVEESPKTPTFCDDALHESLHVDSTSQGSSSNMRQPTLHSNHLVDGLRSVLLLT
nr:retrovirus-related Pol polyprotein from transposon TNT 1-94 [Tanacetum cinerariifolium]